MIKLVVFSSLQINLLLINSKWALAIKHLKLIQLKFLLQLTRFLNSNKRTQFNNRLKKVQDLQVAQMEMMK